MPKKKKQPQAKSKVVVNEAQPAGPIGRGKYPPKIDYRRLLTNKSGPSSVITYSGFNKNARPYDYAVGALRSRPPLNPLAYTTPVGPATWFGSLGENADSAVTLANLQNAMNRGGYGYGPSFDDYIHGRAVSNPLDREMSEIPETEQESMAAEDPEPMYENPVAPMRPPAATPDQVENMRLQEELRMLREYVVNQYQPTSTMETQTEWQGTDPAESEPQSTGEMAIQTEPELVVTDDNMLSMPGGSRAPTFAPYRIPPIRIRVKRRMPRMPEEDGRYGDRAGDRFRDVATVEGSE